MAKSRRANMLLLGFLVTFASGVTSQDVGYFWHITDMHFDPTYSEDKAGLSCNDDSQTSYGKFGDFLCDPPYLLIESALSAMKEIQQDPDFLIWTGDDAPHIWNDTILNPSVVEEIIYNITDTIMDVFPDHQVYSALGNHDWSPKSQLPPTPHPMYSAIAEKWQPWLLTEDSVQTFEKGAYYTLKHNNIRIIVLNTNLFYFTNELTADMPDPANQMQWLDDTLTAANENEEKVIIVAHISPGLFEKHRYYYWFYPYYNEVFLALIEKHQDVIGSMHFGHHHTDTFRVLYDKEGTPFHSFLLAPAVAPWETTLDGVMGGPGNNPAIRLIQYDRNTGEVIDILQYYLHLNEANESGEDKWELEYKATEYYNQPNMCTISLSNIAQNLWKDDDLFSRYYLANGVRYDPDEEWDEEIRVVHICSMVHSHYNDYHGCYEDKFGVNMANSLSVTHMWALICVGVFFLVK